MAQAVQQGKFHVERETYTESNTSPAFTAPAERHTCAQVVHRTQFRLGSESRTPRVHKGWLASRPGLPERAS